MDISWFFPSSLENTRVPSQAQISIALQALLAASDPDELQQTLESWSGTLLSRNTVATLYLITVHHELSDQGEIAEELRFYLYLSGYARAHGISQVCERLAELPEAENINIAELFPLSSVELAKFLAQIQETLEHDEHPSIQIILAQELGDFQAQAFDETQNQVWLEQADASYTRALALELLEKNPARRAYLHMRRGIVGLYRQGDNRADVIERTIVDLEAALATELSEADPEFQAFIKKHLGQAYAERGYDQRPKNLRKAIEAYTETLPYVSQPELFQERITLLENLTSLHLELHDEQQFKAGYQALRETVREQEQLARERLEAGETPRFEASAIAPDEMTVTTTIEEWFECAEPDQLFAFLHAHQDILVTDEALAFLHRLHAEIESTNQDGRAEYIATLVRLLEDVRAYSVEVACLRYLNEVLPALEAISLLMLNASPQEMQRHIIEQLELFSSPPTLAMFYLISRAVQHKDKGEFMRLFNIWVKGLRFGQFSVAPTEEERIVQESKPRSEPRDPIDEEIRDPIFRARYIGGMDLNDPYMDLIEQEMKRFSPQQIMEFMPFWTQLSKAVMNLDLKETDGMAERMLPILDRQQMPYLWALIHWQCAAFILGQDSQSYDQQKAQEALAHCETALSVERPETTSRTWLTFVLTRGLIHTQIVLNDTGHRLSTHERQEHMQRTLADFALVEMEARQIWTEDQYEWGMLCSARGMALADLAKYTGWTHERFLQVSADFEASLPVITRHGTLWQRIFLHLYRAEMLYNYRQPGRQAAIAHVLEDSEAVITFTQAHSSPEMAEVWAIALTIHGLACMERINVTPGENAVQAIEDFNRALSVYTRTSYPRDWAITLINRGNAYMQRTDGDISTNQEQAIKDFDDALSALQPDSEKKTIGMALEGRSQCYMQRMAGERIQNQRQALADCNAGLKLLREAGCRHEEATALVNRAGISMRLITGDARENMRQAIGDCDDALTIFTAAEAPLEWAKALTNRGIARRQLAMASSVTRRSVGIRNHLRRFFSQHPEAAPNILSETQGLYEQALADFSAALTVLKRSSTPLDWARVLRERGFTYALQVQGYFSPQEEEKNIRRGIFDYDAALSVFSRNETPYDWGITMANRAILYNELASKARLDDAEHALRDAEEALAVLTRQAAPANYCRLQFIRAGVFLKLEQWSCVHEALLAVREVQRDLVASTPGSQEQTDIIAEFALADAYSRDAWAILHIAPLDEEAMAIALEEGRALTARMAFELDAIHLEGLPKGEARDRMEAFLGARDEWSNLQHRALFQPTSQVQQSLNTAYRAYLRTRDHIRRLDNPDFMTPAPTLQGIGRALHSIEEALVYLVAGSHITSIGGMAVIVTRDDEGNPRVEHLPLPELKELELLDLLDIEVKEGKAPLVRVNEALTSLGKCGLDDLTMLLLQRGIRKVRLIPYGWLGLFPLSAVLVRDPHGEARHLSELFAEVTVAPSARGLEIARERMQSQGLQRRTLLIAGDPEPHPPGADLPFAAAEARTIRQLARSYGHPSVHLRYLRPQEITRERLIEELALTRYAHLALHAEYCAGDPRRSRLMLAGTGTMDQQACSIYLGEVLGGGINLRGARLLVLSACETSVIDMQRVPNEALGIAAGFVQAGAAAVIASLWPVDDTATFLLMTRFAQLYLDVQGLWTPASALAAAQHWLRTEATNSALATYDPLRAQPGSTRLRSLSLSYEEARQFIRLQAKQRFLEGKPEELPYADPFYWAGFVVTGL